MGKTFSIRSGVFLFGLINSAATVYEIVTGSDGAVRMIGDIFSLQGILWGILAGGIGLMLIAGVPAVLDSRKKRRAAKIRRSVEAARRVMKALSNEPDKTFKGDIDELSSKIQIDFRRLLKDSLQPPSGVRFQEGSRYFSALIPFIEEYGPKEASKMRGEIAKRVKDHDRIASTKKESGDR